MCLQYETNFILYINSNKIRWEFVNDNLFSIVLFTFREMSIGSSANSRSIL